MTDIRMRSPMRREVERRVQEFKNLDERSERQTMRVRISDLQGQLNERHRLMLKKDADHSEQLTRLIAQTAQQREKICALEHEREHLTVELGRYRAMWQEALEKLNREKLVVRVHRDLEKRKTTSVLSAH